MPRKVKSYKKKPNSKRPNKKTSKKAGMMKALRKFVGSKSVEDQVNDLLDMLSRNTIPKKDRENFYYFLMKEDHKDNKKKLYYDFKQAFLLVSIKISELDMSDRQSKLRLLKIITKRFVPDIRVSEVMEKLRKPSDVLDNVNTTLEEEFSKLTTQNETRRLNAAQRNLASRTNMSNALASAFLGTPRTRLTSDNFVVVENNNLRKKPKNIEVQQLLNQAQQKMINNLPSAPTNLPRAKGGSYKRKSKKSRKRVYA